MPRIGSILAEDSSGGVLWDTGDYAYDAMGNIIAIGAGESYRYDALGRLVDADLSARGAHQSLAYDRHGNILSYDWSAPGTSPTTISFAVDGASNRLAGPYTYDAPGRVIAAPEFQELRYDALDRMILARGLGKLDSYVYDASGERLITIDHQDGEERYTLRGLANQVIRQLEGSGRDLVWSKDYVHRGTSLLAAITPPLDPSATPPVEDVAYFHLDHLGTPRVITDAAGQLESEHHYLPFGLEITDPGDETRKFTGHERDLHCADCNGEGRRDDLDYMHARYYSPWAGRFVSVDPVLGQPSRSISWNRYQYSSGNPTNRLDPDGAQDGLAQDVIFVDVIEIKTSRTGQIRTVPSQVQFDEAAQASPKEVRSRSKDLPQRQRVQAKSVSYLDGGNFGHGVKAEKALPLPSGAISQLQVLDPATGKWRVWDWVKVSNLKPNKLVGNLVVGGLGLLFGVSFADTDLELGLLDPWEAQKIACDPGEVSSYCGNQTEDSEEQEPTNSERSHPR